MQEPYRVSQPWSPVGYQVVEVSDEQTSPPAGRPVSERTHNTPATVTPSPLTYRVLEVAEEHVPRRVRTTAPVSKTRAPRRTPQPTAGQPSVWGPVAVGAVVLTVLLVALVSMRTHRQFTSSSVQAGAAQINIPEAPLDVPVENVGVEIPEAPPAAAALAENNAPGWLPQEGAAAGCETFGTAVEFVRNPREAARLAAAQDKLTFLLHVSGNFEDAGFT
jgi:hypothetical protein